MQLLMAIYEFLHRWLGSLSHVLLVFLGILICVFVIVGLWEGRIRPFNACIGVFIGLLLIFYHQLFRSLVSFGVTIDFHSFLLLSGLVICILTCWSVYDAVRHRRHRFQVDTFTNAKRSIQGTKLAAASIMSLACLSVLVVGFAAPQAMIGDEVTHYYMVVKQSKNLSEPNFISEIPLATGEIDVRRYPHAFLWHYFGALVYRLSGKSFYGVQIYQAFFLFQLLFVAYLLSRSRGGVETQATLLYVLSLASLPLCLIFSVAFYQDVPVTAQILTAFYLLRKGKWFWASCFIALAIGFKETSVLFFPAFFLALFWWSFRRSGLMRSMLQIFCSALLVLGFTFFIGKTINIYAHAAFYPQEKLELVLNPVKARVESFISILKLKSLEEKNKKNLPIWKIHKRIRKLKSNTQIIANNPGDLRIKSNFLVYGGGVLWLIVLFGAALDFPYLKKYLFAWNIIDKEKVTQSGGWLYFVGGSYLILAAYFGRTAPDARFFLPGLPFIMLPLAEAISKLKKKKILISVLAALAILQSGYVLAKTYHLRVVSPATKAGIAYLASHPPDPPKVFMYPEGDYRLFPVAHEWYLGYRLREFWRADDKKRIKILRHFGVGAVVIKKHLIAPVNKKITNLGVYPPQFVADLSKDKRFKKVFENSAMIIYEIMKISNNHTSIHKKN